MKHNLISRRRFIVASGAAALVPGSIKAGLCNSAKPSKPFRFLFQGDSITDGNWGQDGSKVRNLRDGNHILGHGYVFLIAARVGADYPADGLTFFNRGVSGNTVVDLGQRWQQDAIDMNPDILSILVGVNDVLAIVRGWGKAYPVDVFEATYRKLLQESTAANPDLITVLGLPFIYPVGQYSRDIDRSRGELESRAAIVRKLAEEFNAVLIDYDATFMEACSRAPISYWTWDGVHPSVPGHELMTREWIKRVSVRLPFLRSCFEFIEK